MVGTPADRKEFRRLVHEGRLFEIRDWVEQGRPVRFLVGPSQRTDTALDIAMPSGIHSLVQMLLEDVGWTDCEKAEALARAVWDRKRYLIDLLLEHNAPPTHLAFDSACQLHDPEFLEKLVDLGVDPTKGDAFASGLCSFVSKPLIRFYKQNHHRIFGLDEQLCIALIDSIRERRVRARVLLLWAGADPARRVSQELRHRFPGYADPAHNDYDFERHPLISAFEQLGLAGDLQFFQQLNLIVPSDQLPDMLSHACTFYEGGLFEHLLDQIPDDQLNTGERNSCKPLEDLVAHEFWSRSEFLKPNTLPILGAIEKLLKRGAKWNPELEEVRSIRSALESAGPGHVTDVVRLLHRHRQSPAMLWEVIRTPTVRKAMGPMGQKLWIEVFENKGRQGL